MYWRIYLNLIINLITIVKITSVNWIKQPQSPCPRMFQYVRPSIETEWFGILSWHYDKLDNVNVEKEHLIITFALPERPQSYQYLGNIESVDKNARLYKITFPIGYNLPKLLEIRVNDRIICKGFKRNLLSEPFVYTLEYINNTKNETDKADEIDNFNFMEYDANQSKENLPEIDNDDNEFFDQFDDLLYLKQAVSCGIIHNRKRFQVLRSLKKQISSTYYLKEQPSPSLNLSEGSSAGVYYKAGMPVLINRDVSKEMLQDEKGEEIPEADEVDSYDLNAILYDESLNEMKRGAWPWMAAIYTHNITSLSYQCSGTLISNRFILTTSDCIVTLNRNEILIFLGRYNLKNWDERGSLAIPIYDVIIHPARNHSTMNIAMVQLGLEVKFNEYIQPACLDYNNNRLKHPDDLGVIISWMTGAQSIGVSRTIPKIIGAIINADENVNQSFCYMDPLNHTFYARDILLPGRFHSKDHGAGFLVYFKRRWYLKGVLTSVFGGCNKTISNYAFKQWASFIDVNTYGEWINYIIDKTERDNHQQEY